MCSSDLSDEVRISLERVPGPTEPAAEESDGSDTDSATGDKLSSSRLAARMGMKTAPFLELAVQHGYLSLAGDKHVVTPKGEKAGVEYVAKSRYGPYFLWPQGITLG